jgi:hypothetical protein
MSDERGWPGWRAGDTGVEADLKRNSAGRPWIAPASKCFVALSRHPGEGLRRYGSVPSDVRTRHDCTRWLLRQRRFLLPIRSGLQDEAMTVRIGPGLAAGPRLLVCFSCFAAGMAFLLFCSTMCRSGSNGGRSEAGRGTAAAWSSAAQACRQRRRAPRLTLLGAHVEVERCGPVHGWRPEQRPCRHVLGRLEDGGCSEDVASLRMTRDATRRTGPRPAGTPAAAGRPSACTPGLLRRCGWRRCQAQAWRRPGPGRVGPVSRVEPAVPCIDTAKTSLARHEGGGGTPNVAAVGHAGWKGSWTCALGQAAHRGVRERSDAVALASGRWGWPPLLLLGMGPCHGAAATPVEGGQADPPWR